MGAWTVAASADGLCGATIFGNLKLDEDLVCIGDGLIVGADGVRIDLNGHSIAGSGTGVGVMVADRTDVKISGGTITNFAVAIRTSASTDVEIKLVQFVGNPEGIDLQAGSIGNTIKGNVFRGSTTRAIMMRSNAQDNDIKNNVFAGNRIGILVFGGADNTIRNNLVSGSTLAGIRVNVIATGNIMKDNLIASSNAAEGQPPAAAIEFLLTPTGFATANHLQGNWLVENDCGLKGPTAGNTFVHNVFRGNLADTCS